MKKLLFIFPIVALLAAGCNSPQQATNTTLPINPLPTGALNPTANSELAIDSISGSTTLVVGQAGTWTINVSGSSGNKLSYGVIFGDEGRGGNYPANYDVSLANSQTPTFSHVYKNSLNYNLDFVVKDDKGNYARKTISVNVKPSTTSAINITSPVGGETWHIGETHNITWASSDSKNVNIYLHYYNSNGAEEASEPITPMGGVPASMSSYSWTIQNQIYTNGASVLSPVGQTFKISVNESGASIQSTSNLFNIVQ